MTASQNERTFADVERLASMDNYSKSRPLSADKNPNRNIETRKATSSGTSIVPKVILDGGCVCLGSGTVVDTENIKRQICALSHLLRSRASVLGTIFGNLYEGESQFCSPREGGSEQQESVERSSQLSKISIEKLDSIVANLMTNPAPFVTRLFVRTFLQMSPSTSTMCEMLRTYTSCMAKPKINLWSAMRHFDVEMGPVEIATTYRRFLGSVVRQLSLCLSKESSFDPRYCYKLGRYGKLKPKTDDERTIESIR